MSAWSLLFVPASLGMLVLLLVTISWIEQRVLSPRALIVHTALSESAEPEHAETFVADQSRSLLAELSLPPTADGTTLVEMAAEPQ